MDFIHPYLEVRKSIPEPASCTDTTLPPGENTTPMKPEYYSVLSSSNPKHEGDPQMSNTMMPPEDIPG